MREHIQLKNKSAKKTKLKKIKKKSENKIQIENDFKLENQDNKHETEDKTKLENHEEIRKIEDQLKKKTFTTIFPQNILMKSTLSPNIYVKSNVVVSLKMLRMKSEKADEPIKIYDYETKQEFDEAQQRLRYIDEDDNNTGSTFSCIYTCPPNRINYSNFKTIEDNQEVMTYKTEENIENDQNDRNLESNSVNIITNNDVKQEEPQIELKAPNDGGTKHIIDNSSGNNNITKKECQVKDHPTVDANKKLPKEFEFHDDIKQIEKRLENVRPFERNVPRKAFLPNTYPYISVKKNTIKKMKKTNIKLDNKDKTIKIYDHQKKTDYEKQQQKIKQIDDGTYAGDPYQGCSTYSCIFTCTSSYAARNRILAHKRFEDNKIMKAI